jgi:hypothetical protein
LEDKMDAYERVKRHMKLHYNKDIDDLIISSVKGYWKDRYPCAGKNGCRHPIHNYIGNDEGTCHTYYFAEYGRDEKGRFLKPFRAWQELSQANVI